jgi:hypothetical protein
MLPQTTTLPHAPKINTHTIQSITICDMSCTSLSYVELPKGPNNRRDTILTVKFLVTHTGDSTPITAKASNEHDLKLAETISNPSDPVEYHAPTCIKEFEITMLQ